MTMRDIPFPLPARFAEAIASSAPPGKYVSHDATFQISPSGQVELSWKSKATLTPNNEVKSWEYEKGTQTLILDFSSGLTIRFQRVAQPDTQIGVSNTESSTASGFSPLSGSQNSWDPISPTHYQNSLGQDIIEFTEELNFNRGNAIKYLFRAGKKDPTKTLEDLEKALWYVKREIQKVAEDTLT